MMFSMNDGSFCKRRCPLLITFLMEVILNEAAFLWKLLKVAVLAILHDGNNYKKSYYDALFKMILMING